MNDKKSLFNRLMIGFAGLLVICIVLWYQFMPGGSSSENYVSHSSSDLVVTNLNVGKADCSIIQYNGTVGIIDTGTKSDYDTISSYLSDNGIASIDFMIITHYDKDHAGSAKKLIKHYNISRIITADYESSKKNYKTLQEVFKKRSNVDYISEMKTYQYDGITLNVIPASDESQMESDPDSYDNNMSLVVMISYGLDKLLFTGDIEQLRIEQMLSDGYNLDADWIKMPHHGRYDDAQPELLEDVTPEYAVISTSTDHPADNSELSLLKNDSIPYYITSEGNVTTICDGVTINVEQ